VRRNCETEFLTFGIVGVPPPNTNMASRKVDLIIPEAAPDHSQRDRLMQMIGAAKYADRLRQQSESHLMQLLIEIEDEKLFPQARFAEFLDEARIPGMSKSSYYRLRDLYAKEGADVYDHFFDWRVPYRTRKLLSSGDVRVEGNEVVIGKERVKLSESKIVKSVLEKLVQEKLEIRGELEAVEARLEASTDKLEKVTTEHKELCRRVDAVNETTPYEDAYMGLTKAFAVMTAEVRAMDPEARPDLAEDALQHFSDQLNQLVRVFGGWSGGPNKGRGK
jgi:hypothetical protein